MSNPTLKPFYNTRAEILVVSSSQKVYGWIDPKSDEQIICQSDCTEEIAIGSTAIIIFRNVRVTMAAQTTFLGRKDDKLHFSSPPSYVKRRGDSSARVRGVIQNALIESEEGAYYSEVLDVSEAGMAFICLDFIRPGAEVNMSVTINGKNLRFKLKAVYCKAVEANIAAYRVGGLIVGMSRTDQVRWKQMIELSSRAA